MWLREGLKDRWVLRATTGIVGEESSIPASQNQSGFETPLSALDWWTLSHVIQDKIWADERGH